MKICLTPFTCKHRVNALRRIFKEFILAKIKPSNLRVFYLAMLHLERYLEKLNRISIKFE